MKKLTERLLKRYADAEYVTSLKARFLLYVCGFALLIIPVVLLYSAINQLNLPAHGHRTNLLILVPNVVLFIMIFIALALLVRGRFALSAHLVFIMMQTAVWSVMFFDTSPALGRLNTVIVAAALISLAPLVITRRGYVIVLYALANIVVLAFFLYRQPAIPGLARGELLEHFADTTAAIIITAFISYNLFRITRRALEQAESSNYRLVRANEELAASNEELQAAMEEIEASNEEFEAQNEELVRSEQELRAGEEKYRSLVENINEAVFVLDGEGTITYMSPGIRRFGNFDPENIIGKKFLDFIHPDDREMTVRRYLELADGREEPADYRIVTGEGSFRWVQSSSRPFFKNGVFAGASGILTDIHRRRITEDKLLREKLFTGTVLDTLPGIFFMLDSDGGFIRWKGLGRNESVFGYGVDEVMTMKATDLVDEKDRNAVRALMEKVFSDGFASGEITMKAKDGGGSIYHISASRMNLGGEAYLIGIGFDITEKKKAEEEGERTRAQLVQAQKMEAVGTLAGGIAHDFNNMLGGIMGSINMMGLLLEKDEHPPREEMLRYIETAMESSRRAADMTRHLLTLSRKSELQLAPVDINQSLKRVLKLCEGSFPKSVELAFRPGSEPLRVMADPVQVEQVLLNLCVNASHAMTIMRPAGERQGGTLSVIAEMVRCADCPCTTRPDINPEDLYVRVSVSDNGVGMDENVRRSIFDPFFTTKSPGEGTGLGLAITYSIVKQHAGFIDVISKPGGGSTFTMCIPALREEPAENVAVPGGARVVTGGGTILVVDDEAGIRRVAKGMLEHCGYRVITAGSRDEAIELYRREKQRIDGVLLDFSMPGATGLEVYERLKEINGGVKVLLTSGLMEGFDLQTLRDRGIRGFIQKPYSAEDLSARIKEILA